MKMEVKLKPFTVPNYVIADTSPLSRGEGMKEAPSFALEEVDSLALEQLCIQFRKDLFKKAGKRDPDIERPRQACECGAPK